MPHRHGHAVSRLEVGDGEALLQGAGDRLLGVDVLPRLGDLERERQMLLIGNGEDDSLDRGIGEHRGEIGHRCNAEFVCEGVALLLRAAIGRHDPERLRLRCRPGEHLGPAAKPDDADFGHIHCFRPIPNRSSIRSRVVTIRLLATRSIRRSSSRPPPHVWNCARRHSSAALRPSACTRRPNSLPTSVWVA